VGQKKGQVVGQKKGQVVGQAKPDVELEVRPLPESNSNSPASRAFAFNVRPMPPVLGPEIGRPEKKRGATNTKGAGAKQESTRPPRSTQSDGPCRAYMWLLEVLAPGWKHATTVCDLAST